MQSGFDTVTFEKTLLKTPDAQFLMIQVFRELAADDSFSHTSVQMLLLQYLARAQCWQEQKKMPVWLKKVHETMNDRWSETLTLKDLSSAGGVHPATISAYFPRHFSCTLGAYMRKLKADSFWLWYSAQSKPGRAYEFNYRFNAGIQRFAYLNGRSPSAFKKGISKKKTGRPATVYHNRGLEDLSHFSVTFKKRFGIAPTQPASHKSIHRS